MGSVMSVPRSVSWTLGSGALKLWDSVSRSVLQPLGWGASPEMLAWSPECSGLSYALTPPPLVTEHPQSPPLAQPGGPGLLSCRSRDRRKPQVDTRRWGQGSHGVPGNLLLSLRRLPLPHHRPPVSQWHSNQPLPPSTRTTQTTHTHTNTHARAR